MNRIARFLPGLFALGTFATLSSAAQIACTEAALHAKIASLNANCTGDKTITFDCTNATILITDALNTVFTCDGLATNDYCTEDADCGEGHTCERNYQGCNDPEVCTGNTMNRIITCDGVTIDGQNKNITLKLSPACDERVGATECTELENASYAFRLEGDNIKVRNLTISHFWEGIHTLGDNNVVENNTLIRGCDDVFTNRKGATGSLFQNNIIRKGCDKCVSLLGLEVTSTSYPNYDSTVRGNTFESCDIPIMVTDGRHLVDDNRFLNLLPAFECFGPYLGHTSQSDWDPVVYFKDNTIEGCKHGLRVSGYSSLVSLGGNTFRDNETRGAWVVDHAKGLFQSDSFIENGGITTGLGFLGGLVVGNSAKADAGGGSITIDGRTLSSLGGNRFENNRSLLDLSLDVNNETSATVTAQSNYWGDGDPTDQIFGSVTFSPVLGSDPAGDGDGDGPPPPPAVWRTDTE